MVKDTGDVEQPDVLVEVLPAGGSAVVASDTTDDFGQFDLSVPSGTYDIRFTPPADSGLRSYLATGVSADSTTPLTVVLKSMAVAHVQGTVRDAAGSPLRNATVILSSTSPGGSNGFVQADVNGHYALDVLAGTYRYSVDCGGCRGTNFYTYVTLNAPVEIDHDLTRDVIAPIATLTVAVRNADGTPVSGASMNYNFTNVDTADYSGRTYGSGNTDTSGNLTAPVLIGLPQQSTSIRLPGGLNIPITLPAINGDTSTTVTVPASVRVQGTVRDAAGSPLRNATVILSSTSPGGSNGFVQADVNGHYALDVLAGTYRYSVDCGGCRGTNFYTYVTLNAPVEIDHDLTRDVIAPIATLTVAVRNADGTPVSGASMNYNFTNVDTADYSGRTYGSGNTDTSGNLTAPVLIGLPQQSTSIRLPGGLNIPITLPAINGDTSTTVTVPASVRVQGTVRDAAGSPLRNATVILSSTSPGGSNGFVQADVNGHYALDVLAGTYRYSVDCGGCRGTNFYTYVTLNAPVEIDHDLTRDVIAPIATLTVAVRNADGTPVSGASMNYNFTNVDTADYSGRTYGSGNTDTSGNLTAPVLIGLPQQSTSIRLPGGLNIPITLPAINGDRRLFYIFDRTTGALYLDDQPPTVIPEVDAEATNGWYNTPVTVTWKSVDPRPSSGTPTRPDPITVSTEGADQLVTSEPSCDPAGNCATGSIRLSIDRTPPTITADVAPAANDHGWHNNQMTVTFTCEDPLAGVATCPAPVTVDQDGAGQVVTGTATDRAGNTATRTVIVNLDTAAPTITPTVSQAPNSEGWNNGDVTVSFSCTDILSGIANCSPPVTLTEDGPNREVSGTAVDKAGNTTVATITVSIDRTNPLIVATRTPANADGWNNTPVTVTFTCTDAQSGIASCPNPATLDQDGADQSVSGTTTNHAGSSASTTIDDINIDRTAPQITATVVGVKNSAGWYQSPPTIHFTCADTLSGIAVCPADVTVHREGADLTVTGVALDKAGNTATAETTDLDIDYSPPAVTVTGVVNGTTYPLDELPTVGCTTTDTGSGVATDASPNLDRDATGHYTATCTGATDHAGNTAPAITVTYTVAPTGEALATITTVYVSNSGSPNAQGVIQDLTNKLEHGKICQYILKVNKEATGPNPTLTAAQAAELVYWARILDPTC
ncbi:carboxypeptidase regulatory-like domain-containing protein [Phytohabitans houttuyneae]|uniref:carboxypeptidase regulatory-like domain-containing protein n=2 Tax=Phytohabitans houttuyneae TaxID=1076126 RepID=UPI0015654495|nr:carboxypeptidase regulatory-like domain-containing protein [Phytohabitans houttuyneae]